MELKEIFHRKLDSILNPKLDNKFILGFLSLGILLVGVGGSNLKAAFSVKHANTTFIAEISNAPDLIATFIGMICLAVSVYFYTRKLNNEKLSHQETEVKDCAIIFQKVLNEGEVGRRLLIYGHDQVLILGELNEQNPSSKKITISRINKDGSKDSRFGNAGKVILDFGGSNNSQVGQIMSDRNGNIYVVAHSVSEGQFKIVICKLLASGHFDQAFGTNGISSATMGGGGHEYAMSAVMHTDGNIISIGHQFESKRLLVAKFRHNGQLDSTFGEKGFVSLSTTNEHDWGVDLIVTAPENKILALFNSGMYKSSIIRLNYDGTIDTSFGEDGVADLHQFLSHSDLMKATSMTLQNDGKILVAGYGNQGIVIRLTDDGSLDSDFAQSGKKIIRGQFRTDLHKIIIRSDGRIFVAGGQSDGNSLMTGLIASLDNEGILVSNFGEGGFVFLKGDTKQRVTDIGLISDSELAITGEESVMSDGFETTFLGILPFKG